MIVPPYAGQYQPQHINVPRKITYRQEREEGCWAIPPYGIIFWDEAEAIPPPLSKTELWSAQQTWPL